MSVNRSIRRAAEKKAIRAGTSPTQLLHSLANLDGVATLSAKLDDFLVASKKMEAIAEKLDEAETIETLEDVQELAIALKEQLETTSKRQELHNKILLNLIDYVRGMNANYSTGLSSLDLDAWESKLKEAHGGT